MSLRLHDLPRYLQRLGFDAPPPPTLATLAALQQRHSVQFVFETVANLTRAPIALDLDSLQRKLLHDGRGGYCYELNGLFQALLRELGFDLRAVAGRVVMGGPEDALTARTHLVALVRLDGADYLADVGFGGMVPTAPLRLDSREPQATPHEPYRLDLRDDGYLLRAEVGGQWRALYVFDLQPLAPIDLEVGNWYVSAHPASPFRDQLLVARTGPGWRKTLNNASFAVHRLGQDSVRRELDGPRAVMEVLEREFGLRLPPGPEVERALARKFEAAATLP
ncbi:arylamine N-acetyltransferase family protein [Lysobacter enzymogenes]|uniref:arylamine N-acetyltransferase family protein n=1 Tax=Lysobacter enzymogenes TaxID=69 RepID=UPI00099B34A9|nr:arylamine N-acetyltransferase [Lysobacter enzymogenes]UZW61206.1 arylamine N-acetyltransferase [Lysobacter enzymogenes]